MSLLRERMVAHMRCRHFSPRTEESYLHAIESTLSANRLSRSGPVCPLCANQGIFPSLEALPRPTAPVARRATGHSERPHTEKRVAPPNQDAL